MPRFSRLLLTALAAAAIGPTARSAAGAEPEAERRQSIAYTPLPRPADERPLPVRAGRFGAVFPHEFLATIRAASESRPTDGGTPGHPVDAWGVADAAGAIGWYRGDVIPTPAPGTEVLSRHPDLANVPRDRLPFDYVDDDAFVVATSGIATAEKGAGREAAEDVVRYAIPQLSRGDLAEAPPRTASGRFENVDAMVVAVGPGPGGLTRADAEALRAFALGGGHVVLSLSREDFGDGGLLGGLIPFEPAGTADLRSLSELEQWIDGAKIRFRGRVPSARFASERGVVLGGTDGPLLLSRRFGFGRVTVFGPDVTAPPLATWRDRDRLIDEAALLSRPPLPVSLAAENPAALDGSLGGQLDRALATFDVVELPRGRVYAGLLLLAVVVGPLDYLLTHRLLRRPRWTWATLPLLCLGGWFAVAGVGDAATEGAAGLRGRAVTLVDEVVAGADAPPHTPAVTTRSRTLFALASDRHDRFDLSVTEAAGPGPVAIGWHAPPGEQFGGRDRPGRIDPAAPEYDIDPAGRSVTGWPIPAGGAKMLRVAASTETAEVASVETALRSPGTRLRGTLTNRTGRELTGCRLFYGGRVYWPNDAGRLDAGETWDLEADSTGSATRTRYLRRSQVETIDLSRNSAANSRRENIAQRFVETPYDARSRDVRRIVEMISLYRAAGGPDYAGLTDAGTESDDFSLFLEEGRAVLLCEEAEPGPPVTVDGLPPETIDATTFRRFVLPVTTDGTAADRVLPQLDPNKFFRP